MYNIKKDEVAKNGNAPRKGGSGEDKFANRKAEMKASRSGRIGKKKASDFDEFDDSMPWDDKVTPEDEF